MNATSETTPPAVLTSSVPAFATQLVALVAGALGLATAWAEGASLQITYALASVVFAVSAYSGFVRLTRRPGEKRALPPPAHAALTLLLPAAFLLFIVVGTDAVQRGAPGWTPFATGLSLALLAACIPLITQIDRRDRDIEAGLASAATAMEPRQFKLAYLALALPAYGWLVLQLGRDSLPQACGAAAIMLLLSFKAARDLNGYAQGEPDTLTSAIRLTVLAAPLFGLILAGALVFEQL